MDIKSNSLEIRETVGASREGNVNRGQDVLAQEASVEIHPSAPVPIKTRQEPDDLSRFMAFAG